MHLNTTKILCCQYLMNISIPVLTKSLKNDLEINGYTARTVIEYPYRLNEEMGAPELPNDFLQTILLSSQERTKAILSPLIMKHKQ